MKTTVQDLPRILPDNANVPALDTLIGIALQNRPDLLAAEANYRSKASTSKQLKPNGSLRSPMIF